MKRISILLLMFISLTAFGQTVCNGANPGNNFQGARQCSKDYNYSVANDFIVPADTNSTLKSLKVSIGMTAGVTATSVRVRIYNDANGVPGSMLNSQAITPTSQVVKGSNYGVNFSDVLLDITPFLMNGSAGAESRYWVAIQVTTSNNSTAYMETNSASMIGKPLTFSDGGPFVIPNADQDGVYTFYADCELMTGGNFPYPYCGPLNYANVEPITLVDVAGIKNITSATYNGSASHQNFVSITGEMKRGVTYPISLGGNTVGNYTDRFVVFIDWNQNNKLDDEGEVYVIQEPLINSTGTDGQFITGDIVVPADAKLGTTRMRVKKTFEGPFLNPCQPEANWGQAEDYSINVKEDLAVSENNAIAGFSYYPNPSSDVVNLKATHTIENASIYNMAGQKVIDQTIGSRAGSLKITQLTAGTYILKVTVAGKVGTYKLLKK